MDMILACREWILVMHGYPDHVYSSIPTRLQQCENPSNMYINLIVLISLESWYDINSLPRQLTYRAHWVKTRCAQLPTGDRLHQFHPADIGSDTRAILLGLRTTHCAFHCGCPKAGLDWWIWSLNNNYVVQRRGRCQ
jgi:hypothetical protein